MTVHTKPKQYVKRVLLTLLIFILSFSVLSMLASAVFYGVFFTRSDTPAAYTLHYDTVSSADYPRRQLHFPSGTNTLTAYCYSCGDPAGLVVIAAGFGEGSEAHLAEAMYFVDHGYSVFAYDGTGVGESEGSGTVGLSQPALDLRAALSYIAAEPALSSLAVYLYGHSAGGYAAAVNTDCAQVKAAVIISGFESPTLLMRETARSYVGFLADVEYPFLTLENYLTSGDAGGERASDCLRHTDIPVAVYEGSADRAVPASVRLSSCMDFSDSANVTLTVCDEAPRNGHSGVWLSDNALRCRESLSGTAAPDPFAANELDPTFMSAVLALYRSAP